MKKIEEVKKEISEILETSLDIFAERTIDYETKTKCVYVTNVGFCRKEMTDFEKNNLFLHEALLSGKNSAFSLVLHNIRFSCKQVLNFYHKNYINLIFKVEEFKIPFASIKNVENLIKEQFNV